MPLPAPNQITTVEPFSPREWVTVQRDYTVLFPDPDRRTGETMVQALGRPLKGENVLLTDPYSLGGCWWGNRVVRDMDQTDSGLQVQRVDATHLSVTSGYAMCCGFFIQINDATTIIDLGDSSSFLTVDSTAAYPVRINTDYYLAMVPDDTTNLLEGSGFGFTLIVAGAWEHVINNHLEKDFATILAVVHTNGSGQIQDSSSITFTRGTFWDRELSAYPPGPPLDPLNGGVVRDGDWYDDWS